MVEWFLRHASAWQRLSRNETISKFIKSSSYHKNNYKKISDNFHKAAKNVADHTMHLATEKLRKFKPTLCNDDVTVNGITDVGLSFDSAWQKRGFTSLNGYVQPMSCYCQVCLTAVNFKDIDPSKYTSIIDDHDCTATHNGTAPAMETAGIQTIFNRSIEKQLRYTEFYGDGDSKGHAPIENIYPGIKVIKLGCLGHVQKRVGSRLRNLRQKVGGLGENSHLNDAIIDQNYYGMAIRSNVGDLSKICKNWECHITE